MLEPQCLRGLYVDSPDPSAPRFLSAASGLVKLGGRVFVVVDDELHLGVFELSRPGPGQLVQIFDGQLPTDHDARKASKPDCEALLHLPAFGPYPHGALMALGSASKASRRRAALIALDAAGGAVGPARAHDMAPLLASLQGQLPHLNIEGGFIQGDTMCLLQRGNTRAAVNARIDFPWPEVRAWLSGAAPAPRPQAITRFDLGAIHGIPLGFTDGADLPGIGWVFSAAAEDTADSYADGRCVGSVIGLVDARGAIQRMVPLTVACKVEGIAVASIGDVLELLLVTDADDRAQPALLMSAVLPLSI